ncbi:MAG TPA: pilus assembly protein N-terminal domain-containing protein [Pirellulaceae bacterium]|nr:pilus assembly protein N-terminal domain-containing protein [Pirellulaceae bacterium]
MPQPILNPFATKARPATVRPLTEKIPEKSRPAITSAPEPPATNSSLTEPAASGNLRPAVIRPVAAEAMQNPHVTPRAGTEAQSKPARTLRPVPLPIANETVTPRPLKNHTITPRPLAPSNQALPAEEEHLAPIISAAEMKKRRAKLFAPEEAAPPPSPSNDQEAKGPVSPWLKDIRRVQKAAATEVITDDPPAPAELEPEAASEPEATSQAIVIPEPTAAPEPAADKESRIGGDASSEAVAETPAEDELGSVPPQPLMPIVPAEKAAPAELAEVPSQAPERHEGTMPRGLLVYNQAQPAPRRTTAEPPGAEAAQPAPVLPEGSPFEVIRPSDKPLQVQVRRSLLLRTQKDVYRTATVDEAICEIVQFTPRELSIIGRSQGSTHVTFWFDDPNMQPVTYVIEVRPDAAEIKKEEEKYLLLEDVLNEMFPDSKIKLSLVADKLIVRGQAKDSEEAFQIMSIVRAQTGYRAGWPAGYPGGGINEGQAAQVLADTVTGTTRRTNYQIVNMLRVPGVQQVALRVKIAELNRTAARNFGLDVKGTIDLDGSSNILLNSLSAVTTGEAPPILFNVDGDDISIGLNALQQHGVVKLLSEPTLVTMSGRPATFLAGGEFAVPTVVGAVGLNAVTTDFRAFGAIISFLPTVVDKDRIRLEVAPEFSEINTDLATGGTSTGSIPSLNVRAATTTVEMREGQTLAIAGLLQDSVTANNAGDLPFLQRIIGRRSVTRNENELIILVTPELVHPMEPEEVPPLPGFDVTEPTNYQFYLHGDLEGNPTMDYRSTVWPRLKKRYKAGGPAMTSGPFGHGQ